MKKLVVFLILSMSITVGALAQKNLENNPKVKKMRKEFYDKELELTDSEASAFWPVFEAYKKEERALRQEYKPARPELLNDGEAEQQVRRSIEFEEKKTALKKRYLEKFSDVLPVRKVAMLEATERKFKRAVLRKIRQNRQGRNR